MLPRGREIASASDAEAKVQSLCAEKGLRDLDELFGASDAERTGKLTALGMGLLDSITQALDLKPFERQRLEGGVEGAFNKKYPVGRDEASGGIPSAAQGTVGRHQGCRQHGGRRGRRKLASEKVSSVVEHALSM